MSSPTAVFYELVCIGYPFLTKQYSCEMCKTPTLDYHVSKCPKTETPMIMQTVLLGFNREKTQGTSEP